MTADQFVTLWLDLMDKGVTVSFNDDMRIYTCHISRYNADKDEWEEYEASCDINVPNPVRLFEQAVADMKAGKQLEGYRNDI